MVYFCFHFSRMDRIFTPGPDIYNGQNPTDLPDYKIATYLTGPNTITAACTGPDDGLTGIKRSKLHLSASYADDIDFIDTIQESDCFEVRKSINPNSNRNHNRFQRYGSGRRLSNGASSSTNDQNANKTNGLAGAGTGSGMRSRKNSKTGIASLTKEASLGGGIGINKTLQKNEENSNKSTTIVVSMVAKSTSAAATDTAVDLKTNAANDQNNKNLLNTKTDSSNPANSKLKENAESIAESVSVAKILEGCTERLLREAVSNQSSIVEVDESVAGVSNWKMECDAAYGISVSLYENNMLTKEPMGNPIADCYGMVVRGNAAAMALADGVNWGDGARLAARSAVHGCLDYLDRAIFGLAHECMATSTQEVFVSLLRSLWEGHGCILEVGGALSTLTIAVVLPLAKNSGSEENGVHHEDGEDDDEPKKYVVCACNVGDSLGYVYSKKHGVREFTLGEYFTRKC